MLVMPMSGLTIRIRAGLATGSVSVPTRRAWCCDVAHAYGVRLWRALGRAPD